VDDGCYILGGDGFLKAGAMTWWTLYLGFGIPALLVGLGYALACYDRWERRRHPD